MERMSTPRSILAPLALIVVAAVLGIMLLAPALEDGISLPAPKAQTVEQEIEEIWENLVDAIRRKDEAGALRIAEQLDALQKARETEAGGATPVTNLRIVQLWCETRGHEWDFCGSEAH